MLYQQQIKTNIKNYYFIHRFIIIFISHIHTFFGWYNVLLTAVSLIQSPNSQEKQNKIIAHVSFKKKKKQQQVYVLWTIWLKTNL